MELNWLYDTFDEPEFKEALGVLEMIAKNPEDLQFYEARLKFLRDERAKMEAAHDEGKEEGKEIGKEIGREEGIAIGIEKGMLIAKVQMYQGSLGDAIAAKDDLLKLTTSQLADLVQQLQEKTELRDA